MLPTERKYSKMPQKAYDTNKTVKTTMKPCDPQYTFFSIVQFLFLSISKLVCFG